MPAITYALPATSCPPVRVPNDLLDPTVSEPAPVTGTVWTSGACPTMKDLLNEMQVRINNCARYGGGGYAVAQGLTLSAGTGLTLVIAAGVSQSDGHAVKTAAVNQALTNGVTSYIYLLRSGSVSVVVGSTTPPANSAVYLGRVVTAGSVITAIDCSGVLENRGGLNWRRTGDAAAPTDTPPATAAFVSQTLGGLYVWNGAAYVALAGVGPLPPWSLPVFVPGHLTANELLAAYLGVAFSIPTNAAGSKAKVGTNPASSFTVTLRKNGSSFGTVVFNTSGVPTWAVTATSFLVTDELTITAQAGVDASLADLRLNLIGAYV